jgi:hypothetical protein
MTSIEEDLHKELAESTLAEVKRFVRACRDNKKDADQIRADAEHMLEEYLDWRSCYGLDYNKTTAATAGEEGEGNASSNDDASNGENNKAINSDATDWNFAVQKALQALESIKRAKELEAKLKETENDFDHIKKEGSIPDMDDDEEEEEDGSDDKKAAAAAAAAEESNIASEDDEAKTEDGVKPSDLPQLIYLHKSADGKPIVDKNGVTILHVMPAQVNRSVVPVETHGLAFAIYLDRKFDRNTEEKVTIMLDTRPGEGWPNPCK